MAEGTVRILVLSPVLIVLFAWLQSDSKNSPVFRLPFYSSFIFLALATLLLLTVNTKRHSKRMRGIFYAIVLVTIAAIAASTTSVATFPPGGTHHYLNYNPKDLEINLEYVNLGKTSGYYGSADQTIIVANYSVGGVYAYYDLYGPRIFTNKTVVANVTAWFSLNLWPDHSRDIISRWATAANFHNGTESLLDFTDHTFLVRWASSDSSSPQQRVRLNKGYTLTMNVALMLETSDQGSMKTTVHFSPSEFVDCDDVEVSSQVEDDATILISGVFFGALLSIPAKQLKPRATRLITPVIRRTGKFISRLSGAKGSSKSFLKACVQCGREIPVASEQCQFCGAKQHNS